MHILRFDFIFAIAIGFAFSQSVHSDELSSPDGNVTFEITLGDQNQAAFSLQYHNQTILRDSRLGFELSDGSNLVDHLTMTAGPVSEINEPWRPVYGERDMIPNHYRQARFDFAGMQAPGRRFSLEVRVYNEGAAFRYTIPEQEGMDEFACKNELTEFRFQDDFFAYEEHGTEGDYRRVPITSIEPKCETPLTIELGSNDVNNRRVACIMEAHVEDYPRMWLSRGSSEGPSLKAQLGGPVNRKTPFATPWRFILLGERPGDLAERSYMMHNLNPPNRIEDPSWIHPGKAIRCTRLDTGNGKAYIDFAAEHQLQYVHFDAGWYGPERDEASDPRTPIAGFDIQTLLQYAASKNISVSVYVNRIALHKYLDEILPLYEEWGIKAIKFGFVAVGKQEEMKWIYDAVAKAAAHHIVIDIHDSYRPTGQSRTYPNLLTQEGIQGNEHMPKPEHNVTLPFTRFPAGAGDYTVCYYNNRIRTTHAHQLAASVVFYSPMQFLFWYDHPSQSHGEPELKFFDDLKTTWDETHVIDDRIGDYVSIARRNGDEWFIGGMTDENARALTIPLSFLKPGSRYRAEIYRDDLSPDASGTKVAIERRDITSEDVIQADLASSGGVAIHLTPIQ